tara:strand:+ start:1916 stop:2227 length:312 start_codon:yes stop_codon:yes gene_type:complete
MDSTVYIVQKPDPKKNIISAQEYGDFCFILPEGSNLSWIPEENIRTIRKVLKTFNDEDFLLPIGDPAAIGVCTAVAAEYNQGRVKFLKWDNRQYKYYPLEVTI